MDQNIETQILLTLQQINEKLDSHGEALKEHSSILTALRSGQEMLRAELSEMKLQNEERFNEIKELLNNHEISKEILKEDNWNNRKGIRKLQKELEHT